ncbi:hypothetical protein [Paramuribaculum intestinale]|uniref:hypothetical protein n=1 Tax=Paramuribaculum intestinale TaxID=2094151 RepID=UPI003EBB2689
MTTSATRHFSASDPWIHTLGRIIGYLCPRLWTRLFRRTDPRLATISSNPAQLYDFLI